MDPHGDIADAFGDSRPDDRREHTRRHDLGTPDELFDVELEGAEDALTAGADEDRPASRAPNADLDLLDAIVDDELTRSIEAGEVASDATPPVEPGTPDDPVDLHVRGGEPDDVESAIAAAQASLVLAYAPSLFAATLVFVATTMVHGMMLGWHVDLVSRAVVAMLVTGVLWKRFQGGRGRAMAFGAFVYLAAFMPWTDMKGQETAIAMVLGLLTVVAGSGLIGVQDDEFAGGL